MLEKYSDIFHIFHDDLVNQGVFDGYFFIDSPLHIDPFLLRTTTIPEFLSSYDLFTSFFQNIISILSHSNRMNDRFFREATNLLTFPELGNITLGYSKPGSTGNGIGKGLARNIAVTAKEIIDAGIVDPVIFELIGLFEKNIGADRISDMTIRIILPTLLNFSARVANNLHLATTHYLFKGISYEIPFFRDQNIILVPSQLLRNLPLASDWSDIDIVCAYNESLRRVVNEIIGDTWRYATRKITKSQLKQTVIAYPELLHEVIDKYNEKNGNPYDFITDPLELFSWEDKVKEITTAHPYSSVLPSSPTREQVFEEALRICNQFKYLMENNGLNNVIYDDNRELKNERYPQLLFLGIADTYLRANGSPIDVSREPNSGRGPVDFKFSASVNSRVNVEIKYAKNNQIYHGYEVQLEKYNLSERTDNAIYLVIFTDRSDVVKNRLYEIRDNLLSQRKKAPELVFVDAIIYPSASRA